MIVRPLVLAFLWSLARWQLVRVSAYVQSTGMRVRPRAGSTSPTARVASSLFAYAGTTATAARSRSLVRTPGLVRTAPDQAWEEMEGNYVLRPTGGRRKNKPIALLHFLGGAFVGAAPHVSYRYMLERLADEGYLVVATPYNMSFNHLEMCGSVLDRFENVLPTLYDEYPLMPRTIVGVGHSCGSLLHLLMSSEDSGLVRKPTHQRHANVFMSFNNKPATESIPYLNELITPLSQSFARYYSNNPNQLNFIRLMHESRAASDVGALLQAMEKAEAQAGQDFDFLLYEMKRAATMMDVREKFIPPLRAPSKLPPSVFAHAAKWGLSAFLRPAKRTLQTVTLMNQVVDAMGQFPSIMMEINDGRNDFFPAPRRVRQVARQSYVAPRTLILQYQDDGLDESEEIENIISQSSPESHVSRRQLPGGHLAPLVAPPMHVVASAEARLGKAKAQERLHYAAADETVAELTSWLETTTTVSSTTTTGNTASTSGTSPAAGLETA